MSAPNEEKPSRLLRNSLLLLVPGILGALTVYIFWRSNPDPNYWKGLFEQALNYLKAHPWALLAAVATLPGLGFPISPLLLLVGIALVPRYGMPMTCALGILAQSFCTIWTYLLSSGPLRGLLRRIVSRRRELPQLNDSNALRLGLILRITPGVPYALQNIVLGIVGMRLKPYLIVSLPTSALWTIGFIVTGGAIFEGRTGLAIAGVLLLIVLVILTKMLQRKTLKNDG
ncbi:MAG: VTT domain-containing protein [Opitutales bacterium]